MYHSPCGCSSVRRTRGHSRIHAVIAAAEFPISRFVRRLAFSRLLLDICLDPKLR